ncbi:DUF4129 domain-containing protein [Microbacterium sp.]|uniref:DUF4129 domain-containing protein n=1 Tax=Microbacterium sp. TaxID=51671 RepID=UPI003A8A076B
MRTLAAIPALTPDGDEAREWAEKELSRAVYQDAQPTPFDRAAQAVGDFLGSLFSGDAPPSWGPWLAVIAIAVVIAVIVLAIVIWGKPRGVARSRAPLELFGETDERPSEEIRADARAAAERGDWDNAIVLRFRALARALAERTVIDPEPGTTVHRFARSAATAFPAERAALERGADTFDDVRYLRRPGTPDGYRSVADLDDRLARATPALSPLVTA